MALIYVIGVTLIVMNETLRIPLSPTFGSWALNIVRLGGADTKVLTGATKAWEPGKEVGVNGGLIVPLLIKAQTQSIFRVLYT